jgi:hypothetical protein
MPRGTGVADSARCTEFMERASPGDLRRPIPSNTFDPAPDRSRGLGQCVSLGAADSCSLKPRAMGRAMAMNW